MVIVLFIALAICFSALLYYQVKRNPGTLTIGTYAFFVTISLICAITVLFGISYDTIVRILEYLYYIVVLLGLTLMWRLVWYSWKRFRSFLLPIMFIGYIAAIVLLSPFVLLRWGITGLALYFVWQFLRFLISSLIYGQVISAPKQGPLVVLGGGLADGYKIGNIVNARIRAAVADAKLMTVFPMIVFSGGQGEDQYLSEAQAMRDWAVDKYGIPPAKTMLEEQSHNTLQNLTYSAEILGSQPFTFYTSEYHVFRGVLLAEKLGITVQGRGGYTPKLYRTSAFFREFAGTMNINKRRHVAWGMAWLVVGTILNVILQW